MLLELQLLRNRHLPLVLGLRVRLVEQHLSLNLGKLASCSVLILLLILHHVHLFVVPGLGTNQLLELLLFFADHL
jgi:hypothetical protein